MSKYDCSMIRHANDGNAYRCCKLRKILISIFIFDNFLNPNVHLKTYTKCTFKNLYKIMPNYVKIRLFYD